MKNVLLTVGVWMASAPFTMNISTPFTGVPLNVLFACSVGTACAFAWSDTVVEPRRKMWGLVVACIFMGAAFTGIANAALSHWTDLKMTDGLQAGMGAAVAFATKSFLPWLAETIRDGKWLAWVPFTKKKD
jgi:hypothetical protein